MSYTVRFSGTGSRCLYWDGVMVAKNLATSSCVDYAKKRHVALREATVWHGHMPPASPGQAWKRLRGFLQQYELKKGHLYPILRRVLGRKRDLQDGRQLLLCQVLVALPGGKGNAA